MKTLGEIIDRIKNLGGSPQLLSCKEVYELPAILKEAENIEQITTCLYLKDGNGILVATNLRMIFVYKGIFGGLKVEDFTYNKISSINCSIGIISDMIQISLSSGNSVEFKHTEKPNTRKFAEYVRTIIASGVAPATASVSVPKTDADDVISKLERLAALKQQGILTEEEFLEQKRKILG